VELPRRRFNGSRSYPASDGASTQNSFKGPGFMTLGFCLLTAQGDVLAALATGWEVAQTANSE
jgi:hypothetical protein